MILIHFSVTVPSPKDVKQGSPKKNPSTPVATTPTSPDLDSSNSSTMMLRPLINARQPPSLVLSPTTGEQDGSSTLNQSPSGTLSYDNPLFVAGDTGAITPKAPSRPGTLNKDGKTNTLSYDNPDGLDLPSSPTRKSPVMVRFFTLNM